MITGWLVKLLVGLALAGIVVFDGGSILVNYFTLDSTANDIANAISTDIGGGSAVNERALEDKAETLANEADARLVDFSVDEDHVVYLKLRRRADTLVVGKIGWIEDWARATAEGRQGRSRI